MLSELYIQNIAVIQKANILFGPGLNAITGETGAGKTVLISSIDAVLGERTSRDVIRSGEEKAAITAVFEEIGDRARCALEELGFEDEDGRVMITREISASGKSSCRINGMPATVSMLRGIAPLLIHIHGQRDASQLLEHDRHLDWIDLFTGIGGELEEYRQCYGGMREALRQLEELKMDEGEKARRIDMLRFQIEEIEAAELEDPEEEEALLAQKKLILGGEKVRDGLARAYAALRGGEEDLPGAIDLIDEAQTGASDASEVVDDLTPITARLEEIGYELAEFAGEIRETLDELEFDPRELNRIESRLDVFYRLKKKYGGSISAILSHYDSALEELEGVEGNEKRVLELEARAEKLRSKATTLAGRLSKKRKKGGEEFCALVEKELAFLDMPLVRMSVRQQEKPLSPTGIDDMEFFIATNAGEPPGPLSRIASGGELARVMLALKNVLAGRDQVDTLIFDEVDSGVSGRTASRIGDKLRQVGQNRQVICVTHLAQVAAYADQHLLIYKTTRDGRTFTEVETLDHDGAVAELARIGSADIVTEKSLESARELWQSAHAEQ